MVDAHHSLAGAPAPLADLPDPDDWTLPPASSGDWEEMRGSADARWLAGQAMNRLVERAELGPNQLLVDVTLESGTVSHDGLVERVVTLRGDVVEFVARAKVAPPAPAAIGGTP